MTAISSFYLVAQAYSLGAPVGLVLRMVFNVVVDMVLGAVPLLGDIFDIGFKANRRNVELLKRYLEEARP